MKTDLSDKLTRVANDLGISESQLVRDALRRYLADLNAGQTKARAGKKKPRSKTRKTKTGKTKTKVYPPEWRAEWEAEWERYQVEMAGVLSSMDEDARSQRKLDLRAEFYWRKEKLNPTLTDTQD